MQSRTRIYRKSFDTYQQAIQKQLNDDFQVSQYLNQNQLQGNIEEYLKLFNSLQVTKSHKKKNYDTLQVKYDQMSNEHMERTLQSSKVQNWDGSKQEFLTQFEEAQVKTCNQIEVKNNLCKEIVQTKKSINLLKGDIGHLIGRNQSATLLQSKITKVKIVADDQLKRVSLAYAKDKDEIKQRREMQRNFNKKIKNVSMFQNSTLNKLKKNYINTMVKKKQIHHRLNQTEKVSTSINQSGDKERLKNQINKSTLQMHSNFVNLSNLIEKMPEIQSKFEESKDIHEFVNELYIHCFTKNEKNFVQKTNSLSKSRVQQCQRQKINSQDLQMITRQSLIKFEEEIIKQHHRVVQEIEKYSSQYNCQVKRSEQMIEKLEVCNQEISRIQQGLLDQMSFKYHLTQQMRQNYSEKLKCFAKSMKTVFVLLEYIEKTLHYSKQASNFHHQHTATNSSSQICTQSNSSSCLRPQSNTSNSNNKVSNPSKTHIPSSKSLVLTQKSYISELYKIYYTLLHDDDQVIKLQNINESLFEFLESDIEEWMSQIKVKMNEGKGSLWTIKHRNTHKFDYDYVKLQHHSSKTRHDRISKIKRPKTFIEVEQQEMKEVQQQYQQCIQNYNQRHTMHQQVNPTRYHSYSKNSQQNKLMKMTNVFTQMNRNSQKSLTNPAASHLINIGKLQSCSTHALNNDKKAMRIRFLQDLDKDYYKMLKSSINMEKQNTRMNYEFAKTFKGTKYSSKDSILEEKRFQSSFSMLFAGKKDQINVKEESNGKKSCFFNNGNCDSRLSKLNDSRKGLSSSQMFRNSISTFNLNEKDTKDLKENVKKMKKKVYEKKRSLDKHHLSIQMKDIINLV